MRVTIEIYREGVKKDWRWRMSHRNGKIVGASSEGFTRVGRCLKNLHLVTGIETQRQIHLFEAPIKKDGAMLIMGRIQAPLRFQINIGRRL